MVIFISWNALSILDPNQLSRNPIRPTSNKLKLFNSTLTTDGIIQCDYYMLPSVFNEGVSNKPRFFVVQYDSLHIHFV